MEEREAAEGIGGEGADFTGVHVGEVGKVGECIVGERGE